MRPANSGPALTSSRNVVCGQFACKCCGFSRPLSCFCVPPQHLVGHGEVRPYDGDDSANSLRMGRNGSLSPFVASYPHVYPPIRCITGYLKFCFTMYVLLSFGRAKSVIMHLCRTCHLPRFYTFCLKRWCLSTRMISLRCLTLPSARR